MIFPKKQFKDDKSLISHKTHNAYTFSNLTICSMVSRRCFFSSSLLVSCAKMTSGRFRVRAPTSRPWPAPPRRSIRRWHPHISSTRPLPCRWPPATHRAPRVRRLQLFPETDATGNRGAYVVRNAKTALTVRTSWWSGSWWTGGTIRPCRRQRSAAGRARGTFSSVTAASTWVSWCTWRAAGSTPWSCTAVGRTAFPFCEDSACWPTDGRVTRQTCEDHRNPTSRSRFIEFIR